MASKAKQTKKSILSHDDYARIMYALKVLNMYNNNRASFYESCERMEENLPKIIGKEATNEMIEGVVQMSIGMISASNLSVADYLSLVKALIFYEMYMFAKEQSDKII